MEACAHPSRQTRLRARTRQMLQLSTLPTWVSSQEAGSISGNSKLKGDGERGAGEVADPKSELP